MGKSKKTVMEIKKELISLIKEQRLYNIEKPIIGLTGGIATGKSSVSNYLKSKYQLEIIDADLLVKEIYQTSEAIDFVKDHTSEAIKNNRIDFTLLRKLVFTNNDLKKNIENFIYSKLSIAFKDKLKTINQDFVIYDVPLLFEKKLNLVTDINILVYASRETQIKRIHQRDGTTQEVIEKILESQLPIDEKRNKAQFIIENDLDKKMANLKDWPEVDNILNQIFN
jgi:dephospho-CoA kinase